MTIAAPAPGTRRGRRILLSIVTGLPVFGVQAVGGLILVSLAWQALGSEGFGLWAAVTALAPIIALADLGIGNALITVIASALGKEDEASARRAVATVVVSLAVAAAVLAGIVALACVWIDWVAWFRLPPDAAYAPALAVATYAACRAVLLPLGVINKLRTGRQENYVNNAWDAVGVLVSLVLFYLAWRAGAALPGLLLASGLGPVLSALGNWISLGGRRTAPRLREFDAKQLRPLLRVGVLYCTLNLAIILSSAADNLVAIRLLGAAATAELALAGKVFTVGHAVLSVALVPLWPAFADAIARRDEAWIRRTLCLGALASLCASAVLAAIFLVGTNRAVALLLGPDAVLPASILWPNAAWLVLQAVGVVGAMLLNGANVLRFQVVLALCFGVAAFALKLLAAPVFGAGGIVWATVVAYGVLVLPSYAWFIRRWLSRAASR
ncbi:MAG TPA: hypothetical protein VJ890_04760 [Vineibacter sp.]|nr:hypothetical protein [Vineibacter sp.]